MLYYDMQHADVQRLPNRKAVGVRRAGIDIGSRERASCRQRLRRVVQQVPSVDLTIGKLKWVTKHISVSCQDPPPKFNNGVSFQSAFRVTRFRLPVSGPLISGRLMSYPRAFADRP